LQFRPVVPRDADITSLQRLSQARSDQPPVHLFAVFFANWEYGGTARTLGSTSTWNIGRERFSNGLDTPCFIIDVDRIELSRPTRANVVPGRPASGPAVLRRAGEVVVGAELARDRRQRAGVTRSGVDLARGPARLAVALGIDLSLRGADVVTGPGIRLQLPP